MQITGLKPNVFQKQIPTILGLIVLLVALVGGLLLFGEGTGVFSPRATPATTPQKVNRTNLSHDTLTISFVTDEATAAFLKYGTSPDKLDIQVGDDRSQISGKIGSYTTHHLTMRGLEPNTTYYYLVGTGSGTFDDAGAPFEVTTLQAGGVPPASAIVYGSVADVGSTAAQDSIVYLGIPGVGKLSSLVKSSGSFAIPLAAARDSNTGQYALISDETAFNITIQGIIPSQVQQISSTIAQAQPLPEITLGGDGSVQQSTQQLANSAPTTPPPAEDPVVSPPPPATIQSPIPSFSPSPLPSVVPSPSPFPSPVPSPTTATSSANIVNLKTETSAHQIVTTTQPTITGAASPNTRVKITVNSLETIEQEVITDSEGNFELDLSELTEGLEPGEHTVEYSYTDPVTLEEVTKIQTFTVDPSPSSSLLAQGSTEGTTQATQPFGSGNPFPVSSPSTSSTTAKGGTESARTVMPSTESAVPVAGSVGTTWALILGGLFFITTGSWSFWLAHEWNRGELDF